MENPTQDLHVFRTAYIDWNGERFGTKAIVKKLIDNRDFTTMEADFYLKKLGFKPKRVYDS